MSPLTQFIYGICDNTQHFINVYIWGEGTTKRGADNIVSCLCWDLEIGGISGEKKVKRLVIIADNYPVKKNVLKFCAWLVEAIWAGEVVLFFLIKGHTKKRDSKFSALKQGTNGVNIFMEQGLDQANTRNNSDSVGLT